jgi:DNA modification methylase
MSRSSRRAPFARLSWEGRGDVNPAPTPLEIWSLAGLQGTGKRAPHNRLIQADNLGVMAGLLPEFEGKIDLIYLDPPFLSGKAYKARIGRGEDSRQPETWKMASGYEDTWRDGGQYLSMLHPRLVLMHRLLSDHGSLYLHLDWHAAAYARVLLDEIFGPDRLLNEIVWTYHGPSPIRSAFNRKHDTILLYTKGRNYTFNVDDVRIPYDDSTVKTFASSKKAGFGKQPDLQRGKVPEDWWYFPVVARMHNERTGYPTQKPEALLERIIRASSNPGDLVADFFSGSGTTAVVAGRLARRWIACDPSPLACLTAYRRLLLDQASSPFTWETASRASPQPELSLEARARRSNESVVCELMGVGTQGESNLRFPEDVVLWEVGEARPDSHFIPRVQSVRGFRSHELALQLELLDTPAAGELLTVRAFDTHGRHGSCDIPVVI